MFTVEKELNGLRDEKYAEFQAKLMPTVSRETIIGVRVPQVRVLAKKYFKDPEHEEFMTELPHKYYDENMLHGLLICEIKDYDICIEQTDRFLPYVDNWTVCDIMSPKVFKKHKAELIGKIKEWVSSERTYTIRFGIEMLMSHYLDEDFKAEYNDIPLTAKSDEYYVKMMVAWYYATALAKKWDDTIGYIEQRKLDGWIHSKTIQKSIESYRISDTQKQYLRTLK